MWAYMKTLPQNDFLREIVSLLSFKFAPISCPTKWEHSLTVTDAKSLSSRKCGNIELREVLLKHTNRHGRIKNCENCELADIALLSWADPIRELWVLSEYLNWSKVNVYMPVLLPIWSWMFLFAEVGCAILGLCYSFPDEVRTVKFKLPLTLYVTVVSF